MHESPYCYLKSGPWDLSSLCEESLLGDDGLGGDTFPDSLTGKGNTINENFWMIYMLNL